MSISRRQIAAATLDMLQKHSVAQVSAALAAYLVSERRSKELDLLMRDVQAMRQKTTGQSEATVYSSSELAKTTKNQLVKISGQQNLHINYQTDQDIVKGARMQGLDWQLDLSVASQLNKLKVLVNQQT